MVPMASIIEAMATLANDPTSRFAHLLRSADGDLDQALNETRHSPDHSALVFEEVLA